MIPSRAVAIRRCRQAQQKTGIQQPDHFEADIGPDHIDFPMSKGHHPQGPENHGKSQGQQCIDAALGDSVDKLLKEDLEIHIDEAGH